MQLRMHIVIFECINFETADSSPGSFNVNAMTGFASLLFGQLNQKFPSILIQTNNVDFGISELAEHVRRKVPVLLLDTRERLFDGKDCFVTDLAKLAGSFPTFNTDEVAEMTETDKDGLTLGSRLKLLEVAFDVIRARMSSVC